MPYRQLRILIAISYVSLAAVAMFAVASAQTASDGLPLANGLFISADSVRWIAYLALIPLFAALAFSWHQQSPTAAMLIPELSSVYAVLAALLNGYGAAYVLSLANLLPLSPMPSVGPIMAIGGAIAFFLWFAFRNGGFAAAADRIRLPYRRVTLLAALAALAVGAVLFAHPLAAILFVAPAYTWIWITPALNRFYNFALAIMGALPAAVFLGGLGFTFNAAPPWWLMLVAAAYGRVSLLTAVAALCALALLIRFGRLALHPHTNE